ncbi:MAG: hypothetical protein LJE88_12960, partial [Deltaproteobacteria bacterium]|nr:hypothetical protein [Deltaproteobacteria bacterium]
MPLLCVNHVDLQAYGPDLIRFYKLASLSISGVCWFSHISNQGVGARNAGLGPHTPESTRGFL